MNTQSLSEKLKPYRWVVILFLVSLVYIADLRFFSNPPLRSDDWNMLIEPTVFGSFNLVNLADRRPFMMVLYALLAPIFQLNIPLYYVVNWLLIFVSAVMIYLIIRSAFGRYPWLALPAALIFLIYPVNYARTWLVTEINTFALLLVLLAVFLILRYLESGKSWELILANLLIVLSFGTYEAGLGLVLLVSLSVLVFNKTASKKRRWWVQTTLLVTLLFILWRAVIQPALLNNPDFYLEITTSGLSTVLGRYVQGAFIFLYNWVGVIFMAFGSYKYWAFLGVLGAGFLSFVLINWKRIRAILAQKPKEDLPRKNSVIDLLSISGLGFLFWAAGYIPVIFLWQPIFYGDGSRVNFAAVPGAAIALVALVSALLMVIFEENSEMRTRKWVNIFTIPLIVLGVVSQIYSQNIRFGIWRQNEDFWNKMFVFAPGIEPGTKVIIVIPGYEELAPFEMRPLRGDWEAESALRVLYNTESLFAEYFYIEMPGYVDNWQPDGCDLAEYLFVFYNPESGELRLAQDPTSIFDFPCSIENYDPAARITDFSSAVGDFRWLVDQGEP